MTSHSNRDRSRGKRRRVRAKGPGTRMYPFNGTCSPRGNFHRTIHSLSETLDKLRDAALRVGDKWSLGVYRYHRGRLYALLMSPPSGMDQVAVDYLVDLESREEPFLEANQWLSLPR